VLRILVCAQESDNARKIYLQTIDIMRELKMKCEVSYTNAADAFSEGKNPRNKPYDILLLDSQDSSCINLASNIRTKNLIISIIFFNVTADKKLLEIVRFRPSYITLLAKDNSGLAKALRWSCAEQLRAHPYFSVKNKDVQMKIEHDSIIYFESRQRIVVLHTSQQAIEFYAKLSDVQSSLPSDYFVRCHQSYIVNMNQVRTLDKANRLFVLKSGLTIEISKSQYSCVVAEYERFVQSNS